MVNVRCDFNNIKERPISKTKLIRILAETIKYVTEIEDSQLLLKDGKLTFRQYERYERIVENRDELRAIDITVEA